MVLKLSKLSSMDMLEGRGGGGQQASSLVAKQPDMQVLATTA